MYPARTNAAAQVSAKTIAVRIAMLLPAGLIFTALACASDNGGGSARPTSGPAERALADPINYKPTWNKSDTDIGGGGIGHFDKDGFNRDLNDFLNP